ncbi:hypothetical protein DOY81_011885 [Sarcophaga bullata]|nr:hypothetical protein DOY81_011885 [Sarcophaga bullata]
MLFLVHKRSNNGSRIFGEAIREGTTPVYGSFKDLTAQAELQIFPELSLKPSKFHANGGDGLYIWKFSAPSTYQYYQSGLATTV